jgi:hypothetical protein
MAIEGMASELDFYNKPMGKRLVNKYQIGNVALSLQ